MRKFSDLVAAVPLPGLTEIPELPVTHLTDWQRAADIIDTGNILATKECPTYHQWLVYAFYGRAAYVPNAAQGPSADLPYAPVCFLFKASAKTPIRVLPFDSGGFKHYKTALHHTLTCIDFEMDPHVDSARKLIQHFFHTNGGYYRSKAVTGLAVNPLEVSTLGYYNLISGVGGPSDERRSAIEFQFPSPVGLSGSLHAVVLPESALDSEDVKERLRDLGAVPIPYLVPSAYEPREFRGQIRQLIYDFLRASGQL